MSANIFEIYNDDYSNPIATVITDYQAAEQFEQDKWGDAVRQTTGHTADTWKDFYTQGEEEQAKARESHGELIKRTKAGKVVASKAFPKTWNTDKAIIGKALATDTPLVDAEGNPRPKSVVQEEYRAVVPEKEEKSAMQKIQTVLNSYGGLYDQLNDEEKAIVRTNTRAIWGTSES